MTGVTFRIEMPQIASHPCHTLSQNIGKRCDVPPAFGKKKGVFRVISLSRWTDSRDIASTEMEQRGTRCDEV